MSKKGTIMDLVNAGITRVVMPREQPSPTPETELIMDNMRVAMNADNEGQRVAHTDEVRRCVEELERERDVARQQNVNLMGRLTRIVLIALRWRRVAMIRTAQLDRCGMHLDMTRDLLRQAMAYCPDRGDLAGCAMPAALWSACETAAGRGEGTCHH